MSVFAHLIHASPPRTEMYAFTGCNSIVKMPSTASMVLRNLLARMYVCSLHTYAHTMHTCICIPCRKSRTTRTMLPLCREEAFDHKLFGRIPAYINTAIQQSLVCAYVLTYIHTNTKHAQKARAHVQTAATRRRWHAWARAQATYCFSECYFYML